MKNKSSSKAPPKNWFYEKNSRLLDHPVNKTFDEILLMSDKSFKQWVVELRKVVVELWDDRGLPPIVGLDEDEIAEQFNKIEAFNTEKFFVDDIHANTKKDVIRNISIVGNAANQWFPTMMKTKINYSKNLEKGRSIYDHFKSDDLLKKMVRYSKRHFKRDSFYHYSDPIPLNAKDVNRFLFSCASGIEWIRRFEKLRHKLGDEYDYWIEPLKSNKKYSGYSDKLKDKKCLTLNASDLCKIKIPKSITKNIGKANNAKVFRIRLYKKGKRLFPIGFKAFRTSFAQYAVNFPALTAKFLYERYIQKLGAKSVVVWDPSAGWGGRILGSMGIASAKVHYIGTDPNTDHNTEDKRTKYHELADFYNSIRTGKKLGFAKLDWLISSPNTYEIFQCGSEVMHKQKGFKKYKRKVDIVFTSPPYFAKEIYSEDSDQSANKFNQYADWRDGFLFPTLKTAFEWLKPGGYLLWNIADVKFGSSVLPLEQDSIAFLNQLGMTFQEKLKMSLAQMPGANRVEENEEEEVIEIRNDLFGSEEVKVVGGKPKAKNFCRIQSGNKQIWLKYEPIFVYQKRE